MLTLQYYLFCISKYIAYIFYETVTWGSSLEFPLHFFSKFIPSLLPKMFFHLRGPFVSQMLFILAGGIFTTCNTRITLMSEVQDNEDTAPINRTNVACHYQVQYSTPAYIVHRITCMLTRDSKSSAGICWTRLFIAYYDYYISWLDNFCFTKLWELSLYSTHKHTLTSSFHTLRKIVLHYVNILNPFQFRLHCWKIITLWV